MRRGSASPFIEGDIVIVPPVHFVEKKGFPRLGIINDGGTLHGRIIDAKGQSFDIYIDHRIIVDNNNRIIQNKGDGSVYLNAYPDRPGSIRLRKQAEFKKKILADLNI